MTETHNANSMQFLECKYAESIEERCCVHRDAYSGIIEVLFRVTGPNFRLYQKDNLENLFFKDRLCDF